MEDLTNSAWDVLGCRDCPAGRPSFVMSNGTVRCPACAVAWPVGPHGVVNSLIDPAESVVREIEGMRAEKPGKYPTRDSLLFQKVEQVSRLEDRVKFAESEQKNY